MSLLIAGSIGLDTITTPFGHSENTLGGSAIYFSLAASHFTKTQITAIAGEDFTENHKKILTDKNVDIEGLKIIPGKTFAWGGEYSFDLNSRTTLFTNLNALAEFTSFLPSSYQNSEFAFLGNLQPNIQKEIISQLKNRKFIGLDTMNYWIENELKTLNEVLSMVDALIINESEARELTKEHNLVKAAKKIFNLMGSTDKVIVIKRGEYGLLMFKNNELFHMPGYPLEDVVDPTGAGDTFAGGFMGYLTKSNDTSWDNLKLACVHGSVMASYCVEKMGIERLQRLTDDEIKKRLADFKQLTQFET